MSDKPTVSDDLQSLNNPDPSIRVAACVRLSQRKGRKVKEVLRTLLADPSPSVRASAAIGLAVKKDRSVVPQLIMMLQEPDHKIRAQIAWALGEIGEIAAIEPILSAFEVANEDDLGFMVRALDTLCGNQVDTRLTDLSESTNEKVRLNAKYGLRILSEYRSQLQE